MGVSSFFLQANLVEPIPKGASGPILDITVGIHGNTDEEVRIVTLSGDVAGWTTKNAVFTYIDEDNTPPTVEAGDDQVVFTTTTLDASQSYDFDGMIVSWQWDIVHRTHSIYNKTATGKTVTVNNLGIGVYDVALTVTDNSGLAATDMLVLSAAGSQQLFGDINGNSKLDLADTIIILKTLSGF